MVLLQKCKLMLQLPFVNIIELHLGITLEREAKVAIFGTISLFSELSLQV